MIKNHLKIAWRNLKKNILFSSINIFGLSVSLGITILLFLFIQHENSFNEMYAAKDRIHRVLVLTDSDNVTEQWANAPALVGPTAITDIPVVENSVRFLKYDFGDPAYLNAKNDEFIEESMYYVDPSILEIFHLDILAGSSTHILKDPATAIISESTAQKMYGTTDVLGKNFKISNRKEITINGVFKDLPKNTTLDGNIYISFSTSGFAKRPSWSNASLETFLLTSNGTTSEKLDHQLTEMLEKNVPEDNRWYKLGSQPLDEVHLYSAGITEGYSSRTGSIDQVKSYSWLAFLILIIACINYMNLTTARSQKRSREVGVSKTLGATFSNLISRFYVETGVITAIAIILGMAIAALALPFFNNLTDKEIPIHLLFNVKFSMILFSVWFIATLLAGSYPAIYLSSFSAKRIMNSSNEKSFWTSGIRKGLVVLQFSASALLIVSVFIIHNQLDFIKNKDLGFSPHQVMAVSVQGISDPSTKNLLVQKFKSLPEVRNSGLSQGYPTAQVSGRRVYNQLEEDGGISVQTNHSTAASLEVLELKFIAGHNLPAIKAAGDTLVDVIVNEKVASYLGFTPEEAIGKQIITLPTRNTQIVGVVENFHYSSLRNSVGGYLFHNYKNGESLEYALIDVNTTDVKTLLAKLEQNFKEVAPSIPFDYSFMDNNVEKLYAEEERTATIGLIFSGLAILVACLGLFGLASFMAEQRDKEIGVRKVLGASILNITSLLSKEFIILVGLALLIAFPFSYWLMQNWLQDYAYRIEISSSPFIWTAISALGIAIITVSTQAVKAAIKNPIEALRKE